MRGLVMSEVLKPKSFPDKQYDRCFYFIDNLIVNYHCSQVFCIKNNVNLHLWIALGDTPSKIVHPLHHHTLKHEDLMIAKKKN